MDVSKRRRQELHSRFFGKSLRVRRLGKNRIQVHARQPVLAPLDAAHLGLDGNALNPQSL